MTINISRNKKVLTALTIITLVGSFLRMQALSIYKFYPDSYTPLVVAKNIQSFGSVIGPMGNGGLIYPDFFAWTRPVFPLLIAFFNLFFSNTEIIARMIPLVASIASIPLSYLFIVAALRSKKAALFAACLLALSYNHSVWGGFILSDTLGIFFLLLSLWLLFRNINKKIAFGDPQDILTGSAFAIAILTRYEYIILFIPIIFITWKISPHPFQRLTTMIAPIAVIITAANFFFGPFFIGSSSTSSQLTYLFHNFGSFNLHGIRGFIVTEGLLVLAGILGIVIAFRDKIIRQIAYFSLIATLLLGYIYYHTNPEITRYFTHLIPFILIPASIGFTYTWEHLLRAPKYAKYFAILMIAIVVSWQAQLAYTGLRETNTGLWFESGYEELAAKAVLPFLPKHSIVIVSFPEPYFLETGHPTQSIADEKPFVYISNDLDDTDVVIIEDEGMRYLFPVFSSFIEKNLQKYKTKEIPLQAIFRYTDKIETARLPVRIYEIKLGGLKRLIQNNHEINNSNSMLQ